MSSQDAENRGRGTFSNPKNRFEKLNLVFDEFCDKAELPSPKTTFYKDTSRSVITYNDSPDIGFSASFNPYRGCEHGCIYCYARPTHEYLGFSSGLDFETKIMVKENAPQLLRDELSGEKWRPQVLILSGVTDPYQPIERKLKITRRCLGVLLEFKNPVSIITKNFLITRDVDILSGLAKYNLCNVCISITTLNEDIRRKMEPRTATPKRKLEAIKILSRAGVPTGVLIAPVIPGLTEQDIPQILRQSAKAGAKFAGYTILRLPYAVKDLFQEWLQNNFPDRSKKVLNKIREIRGGKLNDSRWGSRFSGEGIYAKFIEELFEKSCLQADIPNSWPELSTELFIRKSSPQMTLF